MRPRLIPDRRPLTRPDNERLEEAAVPGGVRPWAVAAPAAMRPLGDPHLLERRPAVGPAAAQEQPRGIAPHETAVHLQPAPVWIARVAPAALEVVDAEPAQLGRRGRRELADIPCVTAPVEQRMARIEWRRRVGPPQADHDLPAPGRVPQPPRHPRVDVALGSE